MTGLLFIGGSQRSGTSLLQRMLCAGPDTNPVIGECAYLDSLLKAYQQGKKNYSFQTQDYFDSFPDFQNQQRQIMSHLFQQVARRYQAQHLVLKHPQMTPRFPELFELFPQAKFLIILRDLRDIAASMLSVGKKMKALGGQHLFVDGDLHKIALQIQGYYQAILAYGDQNPAFRPSCRFIRYEDLVQKPQQQLQAIQGFAGLQRTDFTSDYAFPGREQENQEAALSVWQTKLNQQAPSDSSVGRYKTFFSAQEIRILEQVGQPYLERFQYL